MPLLEAISDLWLKQIETCKKAKAKDFDEVAQRAWAYLDKDYAQLHLQGSSKFRQPMEPTYKVRRNLSQEYVALMVPHVHNTVPHRLVSPRRPPVPEELRALLPSAAQTQTAVSANENILAYLMQWWLNYLPGLYGLDRESRTTLPEALVKGRGLVWHEMSDSPHGKVPASFFGSVDDLFCDADSRQWRDCSFIIRRRHQPTWRVADRFGLNLDKLRSQHQDKRQNPVEHDREDSDSCTWYEVWSRMGAGHRLIGASEEMKEISSGLEALGPHVWLAIMDGVPHPLNLPPEVLAGPDVEGEISRRLRWPVECHEDTENPWPCSVLDFFPNAKNPWAKSPLEGSLPLLAFLDHIYSYLMGRAARASCDLVVVADALSEQVKNAMEKGFDLEILSTPGKPGEELKKLIEIFSFPEVSADAWNIVPLVERAFRESSGMDAAMYGGGPATQDRSAEATRAREGHLTSRPQDFADRVEGWHSQIAAKEALMTRLYIGGDQVAPLFAERVQDAGDGQLVADGDLTDQWMRLVNTDDPALAASELLYTIEGGSGRRKNKQKQIADAQTAMQLLSQDRFQYGMTTGNFGPSNALTLALGESLDMDLQRTLMPNIAPPQEDKPKKKEGASK